MTVVTGYLLVAFNAGSRLSTAQVHFVSATFVLFALFAIWPTVGFAAGVRNLVEMGLSFYRPPIFVLRPAQVIFVLQVVGIFGSLIFMYSHRRNELGKSSG